MDSSIILSAYERIGDLTPLSTDCGLYCDHACCKGDDTTGVYLFPAERTLIGDISWGHFIRDDFGEMLICDAPCERGKRPLACRMFPLTPVKNDKGLWTVRMDIRGRAICPLVRMGVRGLEQPFAKAVRDAIRLIAADSEGEAFLTRWEALEKEYHFLK